MILKNWEGTFRDSSAALEMSIGTINNTVQEELEYRKVSAYWVPRCMKAEDKYRSFEISVSHLQRFKERMKCIPGIQRTGDAPFPCSNKISFNAGEIPNFSDSHNIQNVLVCWNCYCIYIVGRRSHLRWIHGSGHNYKHERRLKHAAMLRETLFAGRDLDICGEVRSFRMTTLHHTAHVGRRVLQSFRWKLLDHPHYRPELAPSDYDLFGSLQQNVHNKWLFLTGCECNRPISVATAF
jgi:hypothetical protein